METPKEEKVKSRIPSCGCLMLIGIILIVLSIIIAYQRLKPNMVLAIYYNRDIPVINDIRTKVELYRYEHDSLPGVPIDAETGKPIVNSSGYSTSHLPDSAVAAGANCLQWMLTEGTESDTNEAMREVLVCDGKILDNPTGHVWRQLDIHYEDLMSGGHDPHYMQYAAIMSSSNAYYLVVGCFGYGRGLPAGTGYAVAEYNDQANKRKFVATFEHYKPIASIPMSIHVGPMDHEGGKTIDRKTMLKAGKVFLPTAEMLLNDYDNAIKAMREFGWQMESKTESRKQPHCGVDGGPVISNIRSKVERYRIENGYQPGCGGVAPPADAQECVPSGAARQDAASPADTQECVPPQERGR